MRSNVRLPVDRSPIYVKLNLSFGTKKLKKVKQQVSMSEKYLLSPDVIQKLLEMSTGVPPTLPDKFSRTLLELLHTLDEETWKNFIREERFVIGEILLRQGEQGDFMYLLLSGRVLAFSGDLHTPMILGIRGVGDFLGEMSMIDGEPRSATVVAIEPVRALRIEQEAFALLLQRAPAFSLRLMQLLSQRLRQAEKHRNADQRAERLIRRQVERLAEEKHALEQAQQARQKMLNFVVHDLRNPLGVIANVLEMLELMMPEEHVQANRDLFQMGQMATERILSLTETLLDMARYEAGQMELMLSEFSPAEMIDILAKMENLRAQTKAITLEVQVAPQLPPLTADRARIERVLTNLLDNAIKHTPYGGKIKISARVIEQDHQPWLEIRVNDTGPGVPPEARQRIFEPFVQLDTSHGGLGLGLDYCRLTVQAHGGKIWVEDGEGGIGSCFVFTLPLTPTEEATSA